MKRQREILSLGPCLVFILQIFKRKRTKLQKLNDKKQKYLNLEETKKLLAGIGELVRKNKDLNWAQGA